jgi:hypothetical protein
MKEIEDRTELDALDPGFRDPGYWIRTHEQIMSRARAELARRQMAGDWTIAEVVFQWRKTLVPLTLLAATLAGIFVLGHEEPGDPFSPMALEEVLLEGVEGEPIPTVLGRGAELETVAFLAGSGGF